MQFTKVRLFVLTLSYMTVFAHFIGRTHDNDTSATVAIKCDSNVSGFDMTFDLFRCLFSRNAERLTQWYLSVSITILLRGYCHCVPENDRQMFQKVHRETWKHTGQF